MKQCDGTKIERFRTTLPTPFLAHIRPLEFRLVLALTLAY